MDGDMSFETVLVDPMAPMATATPTSVDEVAPVVDMQVEQGVVDESLDHGFYADNSFATGFAPPTDPAALAAMIAAEKELAMATYWGDYGLEDPMIGMFPELGRGIYKAALEDGCPTAGVDVLNKKLMPQPSKPAPSSKVGDIVSGIRASRTSFSASTLPSTPSISSHSLDDGGMLP